VVSEEEIKGALKGIIEEIKDVSYANSLSRIADALEYTGFLQFRRLCLDHASAMTDEPETREKLIQSLLMKTDPPPFEERVREASRAARMVKTAKIGKGTEGEKSED
jgi:hypothetical protein